MTRGVKWYGSAVREGAVAGSANGKYRFDGFGSEKSSDCNGTPRTERFEFNGTADVSGSNEDTLFHLALRADTEAPEAGTCELKQNTLALEYQGTAKAAEGGGRLWNGEGRYGSSLKGVVSAHTQDEHIDRERCTTEALSGTTTLRSGTDTAVVTYDGATACADPPTAQWALNGAAQGELKLQSCAATGPGSGWLVSALAAAFFFVAAARRRSEQRLDAVSPASTEPHARS